MKEKIIITRYRSKLISVLYREEQAVEINVEEDSLIGAIFVARVSKMVHNIEAAFLEIVSDGEKIPVFYSLHDNSVHNFVDGREHDKLVEGDEIVVQITKDAVKTKAPIASAHLVLGGQYVVASRGRGKICFSSKIKNKAWREECMQEFHNRLKERDDCDLEQAHTSMSVDYLIRTLAYTDKIPWNAVVLEGMMLQNELNRILSSAGFMKAPALLKSSEAKYIAICKKYRPQEIITNEEAVYEELQKWVNADVTDTATEAPNLRWYRDDDVSLDKLYSIQTLMDGLMQKKVWMKSGAYLVIEYTEAMTVIDVNSGKIDIHKEPEEVRVRVNMEAAKVCMEQIRLRNLSGIIIIDFIDMKKENRKRIFEVLESLAKEDRIKTSIVDFTALGLVEMTRQRSQRPLYEQIREMDAKDIRHTKM